MASDWPEFRTPIRIDDRRAWTAQLESFDQRKDDLYYVVTLHEEGRALGVIVACVSAVLRSPSDDDAAIASELQGQIHRVAVTGRSNTDYRGSVGRHFETIDAPTPASSSTTTKT